MKNFLNWRISFLAVAPFTVFALLTACSQPDDPSSASEENATPAMPDLTGTTWQVEDIDQGGIIDSSMPTIEFSNDGRISGRAGCNNYFGTVDISGDAISVSGTGATQMACAEALMLQERRFFDALGSAERIAMDNDTWLVFYDATGAERMRGIRAELIPEVMDKPATSGFAFTCADGDIAAIRFLGPDTVELIFKDQTYQLPRERSASGAKYAAGNVSFWNQGDSAMIEVGDSSFRCDRNNDLPTLQPK